MDISIAQKWLPIYQDRIILNIEQKNYDGAFDDDEIVAHFLKPALAVLVSSFDDEKIFDLIKNTENCRFREKFQYSRGPAFYLGVFTNTESEFMIDIIFSNDMHEVYITEDTLRDYRSYDDKIKNTNFVFAITADNKIIVRKPAQLLQFTSKRQLIKSLKNHLSVEEKDKKERKLANSLGISLVDNYLTYE